MLVYDACANELEDETPSLFRVDAVIDDARAHVGTESF